MDTAEHSFLGEEAEGIDKYREELRRPLETRLHSRIMATAYKYKLMSPEEEGDTVSDGHFRRSRDQRSCFFKLIPFVLILIIIVLATLLAFQWDAGRKKVQVCVTPECVDVSAYILRKMNRSVDPCVDFYTYSCGGWESSSFMPPDKAKFDTFSEVSKNNEAILKKLLDDRSTIHMGKNSSAVAKLKVYYRTCMDNEKIEADGTGPILKMIEDFGSWSIAPNSSPVANQSQPWDLVSALIRFQKLGQAPLLAFGLTVDLKNSSRFQLSFSQAGLTLENREEYLENSTRFRESFLKFAVKTGKLLGGDDSTRKKMEAIYDFERQLAEIFLKREDLIDPIKIYNLMTVTEFQQLVGQQVDVKRLMAGRMGREVSNSQTVIVATVDYFRKLGAVLANTSQQVLQDYLVWHMVQRVPGYLPEAFVDAAMELNKVERGVSSLSPRWQRCVSKAEAAFGFVSSALYVHKTFPPESKAGASKIVTAVQEAFIRNLDTLQWMDKETRDRARRKALAIKQKLGYPDWLLDPVKLDEYYEEADVKEGHFLQNFFAVAKYEEDRMWKKLGTVPDKNEWDMLPEDVNAFFSISNNQIVFLAGLLQRPYFDPSFPLSFAYGASGMISGHELTHGFDNRGRKFDENGNMEDWWSPQSAKAFQKRSQCMVDQYSAFVYNGKHLNGKLTLSEDIADNGGLKLGYKAYLAEKANSHAEEPTLPGLNLSPEQLFFVGFAQIWCSHYTPEFAASLIVSEEHTISPFRVRGSTANSPQFAKAFNCPAGSPLNPAHKCQVW